MNRTRFCTISLSLLTGIVMLVMNCERQTIVFPQPVQNSTVYGSISPKTVSGMVYLLDAVIVDSAQIDATSGRFIFHQVPFGSYQLLVRCKNFAPLKTTITVRSSITTVEELRLSKFPRQVASVVPTDSSVLGIKSIYADTVVPIAITFSERMDTASLREAFSLSPISRYQLRMRDDHYRTEMVVYLPVAELFGCKRVAIRLSSRAQTIFLVPIDTAVELTYTPDSASAAAAIFSLIIDTMLVPTLPTDSLVLQFRYPMDSLSVERSMHLSPQTSALNFLWRGLRRSVISFQPTLRFGQSYGIDFDSTMKVLNQTLSMSNLQVAMQMAPMMITDIKPRYSPVGRTVPFYIFMNFSVDSAQFSKAVEFFPPVSLCTFHWSNRSVVVFHDVFQPQTNYRLTIQTLVSTTGDTLSYPFTHTFLTSAAGGEKNPFQIRTLPRDTTDRLSPDGTIKLIFPFLVNSSSCEEHLEITPSCLYTTLWSDTIITLYSAASTEDRKPFAASVPSGQTPMVQGKVLSITPNQWLMCDTISTVSLDTVFLVTGSIVATAVNFKFKTKKASLQRMMPMPGQINVEPNYLLQALFNTAVDSLSVVRSCTVTPHVDSLRIRFQASGRNLVFLEHAPLQALTSYVVTFPTAITDCYGKKLAQEYSVTFTTGN
ncbi:MAG: Ig-like domain-containing protein [Chitinivibrionales bacterium]|nr:Ig-like domain-containing protein [Chitinivibrionales bacterium]